MQIMKKSISAEKEVCTTDSADSVKNGEGSYITRRRIQGKDGESAERAWER